MHVVDCPMTNKLQPVRNCLTCPWKGEMFRNTIQCKYSTDKKRVKLDESK